MEKYLVTGYVGWSGARFWRCKEILAHSGNNAKARARAWWTRAPMFRGARVWIVSVDQLQR